MIQQFHFQVPLRNKSEREREIPFNLTYIWNPKTNTKNKNRLIDTENIWMFARQKEGPGLEEIGEGN